MKRISRFAILMAVMLVVVMAVGSIGFGEEKFPSKPIEMIVPYAPGGGTDLAARAIANIWTKYSPQPLVIINKAGGGGVIGTEAVVRAKADGYTLMFGYGSGSDLVMPHMQQMPYDPFKDLTAVSRITILSVVFVTRADSEFKTLSDIAKWAKKNKKPITAAVSTKYGANDIAVVAFGKMTKTQVTTVPFKGAAESMVALAGGHVMIGAAAPSEILPQLKSGQFRALGVALDQRDATMPEIPTLREQGIKLATWGSVKGVAAPAKTPQEVVNYLDTTLKKICDDPAFQKTMADLKLPINYLNSKDFAKFLPKAYKDYGKLIEQLKALGY